MIIGVMGRIGAGKDALAEYLKRKGFKQIAFRDAVVEEADKRGLSHTRENLQDVQRECRQRYGEDYFPKKIIEQVEKSRAKRIVITGLRTSTDARTLKEHFGKRVTLVLVDAKPEIRFERMKKRGRLGDPKTFEEFLDQERRENEHFDSENAFTYADVMIDNSGTLEELHTRINRLLASAR